MHLDESIIRVYCETCEAYAAVTNTPLRQRGFAPALSGQEALTLELTARWSIKASLERWRSEGIGPKFLKLPGRVLYRQADIEAFEESSLSTSTKILAGPVRLE